MKGYFYTSRKIESQCRFCGKYWQTGREIAFYVCPECEEKLKNGNISKAKLNLLKKFKKHGGSYE